MAPASSARDLALEIFERTSTPSHRRDTRFVTCATMGEVIDRVALGEELTITREVKPVAQPRSLEKPAPISKMG